MPTLVLPWHNTPHRLAVFALYRALLSQSRRLPSTSPQQSDALQHIIRNRFKQSQHSPSHARLRVSFEAGYEAIDHLDAAVGGDEGSRKYILDLLERTPAKVKEPKPPVLVSRKKKRIKAVDHERANTEKPRLNLFDRPIPLEKLSGKRHVPVLFSANHIPVLRVKKPQPASLSRFIRQRIEQRQEWHDRRHRLTGELRIASCEDAWDSLMSEATSTLEEATSTLEEAMLADEGEEEPDWEEAIIDAAAEVQEKLNAENAKYKAMAEKMQAVVDREQALYDQEQRERRKMKRAQVSNVREGNEGRQQDQDRVQYQPVLGDK